MPRRTRSQLYLPFTELKRFLARDRDRKPPRLRVLRGGKSDPRPGDWEQIALDFLVIRDGARNLPETASGCGYREPCPYVTCKWHLALTVDPVTGTIEMNHPTTVRGVKRRYSWRPGRPATEFRRLERAVLRQMDKLPHSCAMTVILGAEAKLSATGRHLSLDAIGRAMGFTGEWVRPKLESALVQLRSAGLGNADVG